MSMFYVTSRKGVQRRIGPGNPKLTPSERIELLALGVVLAYLCIAEGHSLLTGSGDLIHRELYAGFVPYAIVGCGILLLAPLRTVPRVAILSLATIVTLVRTGYFPSSYFAAEGLFGHVLLALTALVQVSLLVTGHPDRRPERQRALIRGELLLGGVLVSTINFGSLGGLNPTYDAAIFNIDQHLFIRIPTVATDFVSLVPLLHGVISLIYANIPVVVALFDALGTCGRRRSSMTLLFLLSGYIGYLCYHIVPSAGPPYLIAGYYHRVWPSSRTLLSATSALRRSPARNCMPSLHATWAYLFLLNLGLVRRTTGRLVIAAAASITILAALTVGQHWFVDLVVAAPFTVSVDAFIGQLPWPSQKQAFIGLAAAAMVAAWFGAIMSNSFAELPADSAWIAVLATVVGSGVLVRMLRTLREPVAAVSDATDPTIQASL